MIVSQIDFECWCGCVYTIHVSCLIHVTSFVCVHAYSVYALACEFVLLDGCSSQV